MASQQVQAERLALRILSSCTRRVTPPMGSEMPGTSASNCPPPMISPGIRPFDSREGLKEDQAVLAVGREMIVAAGSQKVPGPTLWKVTIAYPPEADIIILDPPSRTPLYLA